MDDEKNLWCLMQGELFKGVAPEEFGKIEDKFRLGAYKKGEIIFDPDDCCKVFMVKEGKVQIYHLTADGKKVIVDVLRQGAIFGDLGDESSDVFVEAMVDSQVCSLDKDTFFRLVSAQPTVSERLMKYLFDRLAKLEKRTSSIAVDNALKRVVKLLLSLGRGSGESHDTRITDRFTHEELSQMLGISRQTVTVIINRLEKQGAISRSGKKLQFSRDRLQKVAEEE